MSYSSTNNSNMYDGRQASERTIVWRLIAGAVVGLALLAINVVFWP